MAELQQPNIVGNFLSSYATAQDRQREQQDAMYQRARQGRFDQMAQQKFDMDMDASQLDMSLKRAWALEIILAGVDERNPQTLEVAKQRYMTSFGGRPEDVANITMADIPRMKMKTGQLARELNAQLIEARIGTEQAQGRAADALADARRMSAASGGGGSSIPSATSDVPAVSTTPNLKLTASNVPAVSTTPNLKLTEGQSKDVGFYLRAVAANEGFTEDRVKALTSDKQALVRAVPVAGRKLQSDASRQATQVASNFIAAVLRKDTGAAVTDKEFAFYKDIFIPQWGDDNVTLGLKAQAREAFLTGLRNGMSNLAALEAVGIVNIPKDFRPLQPAPTQLGAQATLPANSPAASPGASAADKPVGAQATLPANPPAASPGASAANRPVSVGGFTARERP
jgi:hypothetical protein